MGIWRKIDNFVVSRRDLLATVGRTGPAEFRARGRYLQSQATGWRHRQYSLDDVPATLASDRHGDCHFQPSAALAFE